MTRKVSAPQQLDPIANLEAKVFGLQHQLEFAEAANARLELEVERLRCLVEASPVREWLTVPEAASLCGYGVHAVREWCNEYSIGVLHKRVWRINRQLLVQFLIDRHGADKLPVALRGMTS